MKSTLSSPRDKSLSVRLTPQNHFLSMLQSHSYCIVSPLTVNYIMSRNDDDISQWRDCGALDARTAHGGCPCWRHYRDSTHK